MAGRPSRLADPEFAERVAELFVSGMTHKEMAHVLGVNDARTIGVYKRDPRVQVLTTKLIKDRVLTITRRTDSEIAKRLENPDDLTVKEILEIRKEFLGGALRSRTEEIDEHTVNEAANLFESNPELADQLQQMLAGNKPDSE